MPCPLLGHVHGLQGLDMGLGGHLAVGGHSPCAEGRGKVLPRPPGGRGLGWGCWGHSQEDQTAGRARWPAIPAH